MSGKSDDNPGFVTRAECAQISSDVKGDLKTIRVALVGEDMRGGLVKDVGTLQNTVDNLKKERDKEHSVFRDVLKSVVAPIVVAVVVAVILTWPW